MMDESWARAYADAGIMPMREYVELWERKLGAVALSNIIDRRERQHKPRKILRRVLDLLVVNELAGQ